VRRCQIKIRRDPSFPGCIYSEMKMCLAPCFAGCTDQEYLSEVARAAQALVTAGVSLELSLEREREGASEALDFERAAALHKKLEKVSDVMKSLPELARRVDQLDAVVLQRATEKGAVAFFAVRKGIISDPFFLRFGDLSSQPRSVEALVRVHLEGEAGVSSAGTDDDAAGKAAASYANGALASGADLRAAFGLRSVPEELQEHLSLLARWFYAKPREGEILFRDGDWPYRRLLRACARILSPPRKVSPPAPPS